MAVAAFILRTVFEPGYEAGQLLDGFLVRFPPLFRGGEFRVTENRTYLKDHFPTDTVYGPTPDAELRLITCGGAFDPATHHYLSNIIVYATQVR